MNTFIWALGEHDWLVLFALKFGTAMLPRRFSFARFCQVCVFSLLWAIITYAFAIIMRSLTEGSTIGTTFFKTVPESINTLLLPAVFGANADVINAIAKDNPGLWPIMVFFMALVSVTIMYMLLGVLVDVIGAVASTETWWVDRGPNVWM